MITGHGRLITKEIIFKLSNLVERKVTKSNETSCKVNVPKTWHGKTVYVILKDE